MNTFLFCLGAAAGYAACWFSKDYFIALVNGTEHLIQKLEAKIKVLRE